MHRYKILYTPFYFITLFSLSILLTVFGFVLASFFASQTMMGGLKENVAIIVELQNQSAEDLNNVLDYLNDAPHVVKDRIKFISREDALKLMGKELGATILSEGSENPFRDVVEFYLNADDLNLVNVQRIEQDISQLEGNYTVHYPPDLFASVQHTMGRISFYGAVLVAVLFVVIIMLIHQIMKMNVVSNRFLIRTMEMVGAKRSFIRKPFRSEAIKLGILASIVAVIIFTGCAYFFDDLFNQLGIALFTVPFWIILTAVVILGVVISAFSSQIALNRYMGRHLDTLYG